MLFKNKTGKAENVKVKSKDPLGFSWITVKDQDEIDLPIDHGQAYGFTLLYQEETETAEKKKDQSDAKQTIQAVEKKYWEKLISINGVGIKTARDITRIYPTEKDLKDAVKEKVELPIRDDLVPLIKKRFKTGWLLK